MSVFENWNAIATEAPKIIEQSHGIKPAILGAGTGAATAAAGHDWIAIAGLCLTGMSILIAAGSLYLGYLNYQERRRENDLKEASHGCDDND